MSRKGRLKPEDEKVIRENIIFLKEQLDAKYLVDFLFQYNVISLDDVINIREDTSRVRRNEKLIELLLHSGPGDSFKYFLKSLERQYSHVLDHLKATASAPFNNLDLEADEETDSVRSVRNTHDNTRNNARSNVEQGIANAAAPINYPDLQADAENNSVVSGRNTLDNIRNNASNVEQGLGNGNTNVTVKLESQEIKELLFGADGKRLPSGLKRIKTLGHGAYGSVFLETIQSSKGLTEIAVKQIHVQDATKKDKFEKSFKNETLALNQLTHERIVEFYGYISTDLTYHIFIEYLPGGSLSEYIDKMKIIAEEKARNLTRQILEGIAYIHSKMFFHRDIKSSNVLMSDENTVKLADFGLTREYEELTVSCTEGVGTYRFMAPEMLDKKYNKYVDIWALGCVVLHMLTGQYPFHELKEPQQVLKILIKKPLPLEGVSVQFSRKAKQFLENTFHLEPKSRPSADRLLEDPFITGN